MNILTKLFLLVVSTGCVSASCETCEDMMLSGTGGFSDKWPILHHTWTLNGDYNGMPSYTCFECFGSRKQLIWMEDRWSIVDCLPDQPEACHGSHEILRSPSVSHGTCVWDVQGTWIYCSGALTTAGCSATSTDTSVAFTCI